MAAVGGWWSLGTVLKDGPSLKKKILLPSAKRLEEGRGTTIFEAVKLHKQVVPQPPWEPPPPKPKWGEKHLKRG